MPQESPAGNGSKTNPLTRRTPQLNHSEPLILSEMCSGSRGIVACVHGGRELTGRLAAMGLTAGTEIVVLQNRGLGPVLALVRDTRIALGRIQAGQVTVNECRTAADF